MSDMRENFSEYFSERDMFLMCEAMNAGHYYKSLDDWLSDVIADGGYIVAQHLSHDANKKKAARAQGDAEPVLSKYQPCGCVICTCESDERCLGCGAVHCGNHPVSDIPNPIYTRSPAKAPDYSVVLESIRDILSLADERAEAVCCGRPGNECCGSPEPEWGPFEQTIMQTLGPIEKMLATFIPDTTPQADGQIPDWLYDGYAVYQNLTDEQKTQTNGKNVSDTLDAIVAMLKRPQPPKQEQGND